MEEIGKVPEIFNERVQAFITVWFYRELKESFGARGVQAFIQGTQSYGEQRGRRMAQRAIRAGEELTLDTYLRRGEWVNTEQIRAQGIANKAEIEAEKTLEEKRDLYRTLLANLGIDETRIEAILKITDFADKTVKDGAFENAEALAEAAKAAYLDPVTVQGAEVATPPDNTGARPTREEIMAIADTAERQRAIAENLDIFGA